MLVSEHFDELSVGSESGQVFEEGKFLLGKLGEVELFEIFDL